MIKLGVIYGGISTEHDVSEMSAKSVIENLDKENLVATAKMLKELSKGKQIVYFSCHESRKI